MALKIFSFIVKVWIDDAEDPGAALTWHGLVKAVPDGRELYVRDVGTIANFVKSYLLELGVKVAGDTPNHE